MQDMFFKKIKDVKIIHILFFVIIFIFFIARITKAIPLEYAIPGPDGDISSVDDLSDYIRIVYSYGIYAGSVLAVVMISVNAFKWVSAGGNKGAIDKAKNGMIMSIIGLFLVFGSYLILSTINGELVALKALDVKHIDAVNFMDGSIKPIDEKSMAYWEEMTTVRNLNLDCKSNGDCTKENLRWTCLNKKCHLKSPQGASCDRLDNEDCFPYLTCLSTTNSCEDLACQKANGHPMGAYDACRGVGGIFMSENIVDGYCSKSQFIRGTNKIPKCIPCAQAGESCKENEQCAGVHGRCGNHTESGNEHGNCYAFNMFASTAAWTCKDMNGSNGAGGSF